MQFNLADIFESRRGRVPGARSAGLRRAATHLRAARRGARTGCAHALAARGVGAGDHVGLYLHERRRVRRGDVALLQAACGAGERELPLRRGRAAVPPRDADLVARAPPAQFAPRLAAVRGRLAEAAHVLVGRRRQRRRSLGASAPRTTRRRSPALAASATSPSARPTISTCSTPAAPPACRRA